MAAVGVEGVSSLEEAAGGVGVMTGVVAEVVSGGVAEGPQGVEAGADTATTTAPVAAGVATNAMAVVTAMGAEEVEAVITTEVAETLLPGTAVAPRWDVAAPGTMEVQTVTVVVATGVVAQVDTKRDYCTLLTAKIFSPL